jgi:hypothetical protein
MKSKIAWDNHCMRKFGGSIRKKIIEAYVPFAKAKLLTEPPKKIPISTRN